MLRNNLQFSLDFLDFFEHVQCRGLHALRLQRGKLTGLPDVPVSIPVLCDLPDPLQVVYILYDAYGHKLCHLGLMSCYIVLVRQQAVSDLLQHPDGFERRLFYFEEGQPMKDGVLFLYQGLQLPAMICDLL